MSGAAETLRQVETKVKACAECGARFGRDAAFCPFDGSALTTAAWDRVLDARMPTRVAERYDVIEPLGEGGMGTVYRVRHTTLDRAFAMKVLRRDLARDTELAERFVQEAKATARIRHPAIVAITDFGTFDDGVPWFVMELLRGQTLATELREHGALPAARVIALGKKIAEGLAASHAANVIHRDLKPENVFVHDDEVRIVDFGAAKVIGASKLTRPGVVFGTPYYMAPEQASGLVIDARADVYSLGILLYELVTGRVPFEADTYMGVLTKHLYEAPPPPLAPGGLGCGPLEDVILRALAKEPDQRFASMDEIRRALDRAGAELAPDVPDAPQPPRPVRAGPLALGAPSAADRIEESISRHVAEEARRRRSLVVAGIVGGCAVIGLAGAVVAVVRPSPAQELVVPRLRVVGVPSAAPAPPPVVAPPPSRPEPEPEPEPAPPTRAEPPRSEAPRPVRPRPAVPAPPSPSAAAPNPTVARPPADPPPPRAGEEFRDPWK